MTAEPVRVLAISARATHPLRLLVLRPGGGMSEACFAGDEAAATFHLGAFAGEHLVGVSSVYHEAPVGETSGAAWRLRGMAVAPELQRCGVGSRLLRACFRAVEAKGGTLLWCNARIAAVPFYARMGFFARGDVFHIAGVGPHKVMLRRLDANIS